MKDFRSSNSARRAYLKLLRRLQKGQENTNLSLLPIVEKKLRSLEEALKLDFFAQAGVTKLTDSQIEDFRMSQLIRHGRKASESYIPKEALKHPNWLIYLVAMNYFYSYMQKDFYLRRETVLRDKAREASEEVKDCLCFFLGASFKDYLKSQLLPTDQKRNATAFLWNDDFIYDNLLNLSPATKLLLYTLAGHKKLNSLTEYNTHFAEACFVYETEEELEMNLYSFYVLLEDALFVLKENKAKNKHLINRLSFVRNLLSDVFFALFGRNITEKFIDFEDVLKFVAKIKIERDWHLRLRGSEFYTTSVAFLVSEGKKDNIVSLFS